MQNDKAVEQQNGHQKGEASREKPVHRQENAHIKAQILVQVGGKIIGEYRLSKLVFTIGRYPTSDIQIPSTRVSRFHAMIRWKNGAWVIEDVESLNGLTCQGQRIDQLALVDGDRIHIDPTIVLHYEELG